MSIAASVDTNVLARLLVQDDASQHAAVVRELARRTKQGGALFVPVTVMLELEWVLRARYRCGKAQVLSALTALLSTAPLAFESEGALEQALFIYEDGNADFAECLHLALAGAQDALPFLTFDRNAAKLKGARVLR